MKDPEGERFLNMIEALVGRGAEVRVGKRRTHVILRDDDGMSKITMDMRTWRSYEASGRPMPRHKRAR